MSFTVLSLAAFALTCAAVSVAVALGLRATEARVESLAPTAQARLYLTAALLPVAVAIAVLIAALAPSFGWIADHCGVLGDPHGHPHLCTEHDAAAWPAVSLQILAILLVARVAVAFARRGYALALGASTRRALDRTSAVSNNLYSVGDTAAVRVLPVAEAQAFVLGLIRPSLYVTRGLLDGAESVHLDAVLAHERAHLARRDPLRRFLAGIGLAFHLPGVAGSLDRRLAQAQEMAADDVAARSVHSREAVARALVALTKAQRRTPYAAFAFAGSNIATRVHYLLESHERFDQPSTATLLGAAGLGLLAIGVAADPIHHGVEIILGALGH